ncbi:MAG: hypothetical protein ACPGVT_04755 [Maricaulaceae bacterium]
MQIEELRGCEIFTAKGSVIELRARELNDLAKVVTLAIFLSRMIYPDVIWQLGMRNRMPSEKEKTLKNALIEIYKRDYKKQGEYLTEEVNKKFLDMALEYQCRRFGINEFDKQKAWAEIGKTLTRKYFQSKANYRYPSVIFLNEMRWGLKVLTSRRLLDLKSRAESNDCNSGNRLILYSDMYDIPFTNWHLNSVEISIEDDVDRDTLKALPSKISSRELILACKSAVANPPFYLNEMWSNIDEIHGYSAASIRGLENSIAQGKRLMPVEIS